MNKATAGIVGVASALAGLAAGYRMLARTRCLTWGATAEEAARAMPGDGLLSAPDVLATRAVTIAADPAAVWPWLVQIGPGRGGAYTYDWIENLLGLDMHSAESILPQYQNLSVGQTLPLGSSGPALRVAIADAPHALVFASLDHRWVWAFGLYPVAGGTRLVSRNRIALPHLSGPSRFVYTSIMEPGSLVMERKMLLGIKERAERKRELAVTNGPGARSESPYSPGGAARTLEV